MNDPRPDLKYDSEEWTMLLRTLDKHSPSQELTGVLHGFRCAGLRLHRGGKGYALRPDLGPIESGLKWQTKENYFKDRDKWLLPWGRQIIEILQALTKEMAAS